MGGVLEWVKGKVEGLGVPLLLLLILGLLVISYQAGPPWFLAVILISIVLLLGG